MPKVLTIVAGDNFLPYLIDLYKFGNSTSGNEGLVAWYRLNEAGACADGGTTADTVSQLQLEYWPKDVMQNKIFYSTLLSQPGEISVTLDGVSLDATWTNTPSGNVGVYHGSVSFSGQSGETPPVEPPLTLKRSSLGYCPVGAYVCSKLGPQPTLPKSTGTVGYPAAGESANYAVSPSTPDTCVAGTGGDEFTGLCSFGCNYGYCPIYNCTCTATGPLIKPPTQNTSVVGWAPDIDDNGLCSFAVPETIVLCRAEWAGTFPCDFSINYSSLDALEADIDNLDPYCIDFYVLGALYGELETTLANYTNIAHTNNYDEDFIEYSKYMKAQVEPQLMYFMNDSTVPFDPKGLGNRYFTCTRSLGGINGTATSCPDEDSYTVAQLHIVYFDLVDPEGFYTSLTENAGVEPDWVTLDGGFFPGSSTGPYYGKRPECRLNLHSTYEYLWWQGFPIPAQEINFTDPREIMRKALPNIPNLQLSISLTQLAIASGSFQGVIDDVVQTTSTAVFVLSELVDRIYNVVYIGRKIAAEERTERILKIIGGIFMILPFLGPLSGLGDLIEGFDALLALTGTIVDEGSDVYSVIQNPESAPVAILGMLLGFDAGSEVGEISDESLAAFKYDTLAASRRKMESTEIKAFGKVYEDKMNQLDSIVSKCF
ncbi:Alpha-1,3-glucanase/mutanase, putative [Penicillium digitatum]|uniref:Alpha-1,3-glucanase/mutanase, putative n=1 Tax=Penicillium digitatum TaxID=36651 RepID=A0A7T7BP08_PENDI|nr:Alpha-1,3-glucanase/mutanase, putative [Penicillium digitatum]